MAPLQVRTNSDTPKNSCFFEQKLIFSLGTTASDFVHQINEEEDRIREYARLHHSKMRLPESSRVLVQSQREASQDDPKYFID